MTVCKGCGRRFQGGGAGGGFCSAVCALSGGFVAGKGDTSKPSTEYKAKKPRKPRVEEPRKAADTRGVPLRISAADHPRVLEMFSLPESERAALSATFTPEERECARRIGRRMLEADRRMDAAIDWDCGEGLEGESASSSRAESCDRLGDSDDGSV